MIDENKNVYIICDENKNKQSIEKMKNEEYEEKQRGISDQTANETHLNVEYHMNHDFEASHYFQFVS